MCGIFGYIGDGKGGSIVVSGLKKLEYRGYDSWGIAQSINSKIDVIKGVGKISDIAQSMPYRKDAGLCLGHTRWSTHGEPNKKNAHPHTDCKGDIAIVHNGIIENYSPLKDMLAREGHRIVSDTDTEIVSHLIEKFYSGNLEEAVRKALKLVEGTYGLAVIHKNENKIVAARNGSPLIIGIGNNEMMVASDAAAMLKYTNKVVYLNDKEVATVTRKGFSVKNLDNEPVQKDIEKITWNLDQIEKKGFRHFMLKEIFEQPDSVRNTLRGRLKERIKITVDIDVKKIKRIIITACGTSWHSALIGKYMIEELTAIPTEVDYASELRYRNPIMNENDLLIAISQSGETADTLAALREAKKKQTKTLGIVNVVGSAIAREADTGIYLHAGPEIGVASTKAFTSQLTALAVLALYLKQEKGMDIGEEFIKELKSIPKKIESALKKNGEIRKLAKKFVSHTNFLYLGRGLNFPVALEGALKLKEISYIHAEGYPAAEMKHGPIALIDENMPVVFIVDKNQTYEKILSNMEEVKARKGIIITITSHDDKKIRDLSSHVIRIPKTTNLLSPLISVIPVQLLAYHIADLKGLDVDHPKNLSKCVSVE